MLQSRKDFAVQEMNEVMSVLMGGSPISLALVVVLAALGIVGMALWALIHLVPSGGKK